MQLTVTMQLSRPVAAVRQAATARPVRAFSGGSAYMGARIQRSKALGLPQLPSRRCRSGAAGQRVSASFFGVGAPEAIVVGVVALVVFGPKGLAQAAKSVGATLRSFAPTIREITSVSQELKQSLEQEIGFNEIKEEFNRPALPTPRPVTKSTDEEQLPQTQQQGAALSELADSMAASGQRLDDTTSALLDPEIEKKRAAAAAAAWGSGAPSLTAAPSGTAGTAAPGPPAAAAAAATGPPAAPAVEAMSLAELEAELAKRTAAVERGQLPKQLSADDA